MFRKNIKNPNQILPRGAASRPEAQELPAASHVCPVSGSRWSKSGNSGCRTQEDPT